MKKPSVQFTEFPEPIKAKIIKGVMFGMLAVLATGILAYALNRIELMKAGFYLLAFALIYSARYYYYACMGRVVRLEVTVAKTEDDKLTKSSTLYTLRGTEQQLYSMVQIKQHGKANYREGDTLDIYVDRDYIEKQPPSENGAKRIVAALAIIQTFAA